jgi:putative photosynthetic complex assembly protein 2
MMTWMAPLVVAVATWWAATGLILWLVRRPRATYRVTLAASIVAAAVALAVLIETREIASVAAAYAAFLASLTVWGVLEVAFLTGVCTGPRRHGCPSRCGGIVHARHAFEAISHHELALLAAGALVVGIGLDAANPVGAWTFGLLWVARLSAKLNLHLGVRNTGASMLPAQLRHLASFFRTARMNPLFPVSMSLGVAFALACAGVALDPAASRFEATAAALVGGLAVLAVVEHAMLMLPLPADAPWAFLRAKHEAGPDPAP